MVQDPVTVRRCARQHGLAVPSETQPAFELLSIAETCAGLGTTRVYFQRKGRLYMHVKPVIRPGSSLPRVIDFALLLRHHPRLKVVVEGHESTCEGVVQTMEDGREMRASLGQSEARARVVKDALLEYECLERISRIGSKVWGKLPQPRFADRITCRGWEDSVSEAAGWSAGLESAHAELYFTLGGVGGVEVPARSPAYAVATRLKARAVGWENHFASISLQAPSIGTVDDDRTASSIDHWHDAS